MPQIGDAWHIPANPEPRGRGGMLDPVGTIVPGTRVTIISGNQFQGPGNPGNQLEIGSAALVRSADAANWTLIPMTFLRETGNNKYFAARIAEDTFDTGDVVEYYLRIAYDDHDTTFVHAAGPGSATTAEEGVAQAAPFTFTVGSSAQKGCWHPVFELPNVAIHTHVLPTGQVLLWGRRDRPDQGMNEHSCTPYLWNPVTDERNQTPPPKDLGGNDVNLFCSGHAFLPDGRLLVVGGHWLDGVGIDQATIFNPWTTSWTPTAAMTGGRWYPTATTLADGRILVTSGSDGANGNNRTPQIWDNGAWTSVARLPDDQAFDLYPRMHTTSAGAVFMSGPLAQSWSLSTAGAGQWTPMGERDGARRDYAPAVAFAPDHVAFIGGGNDASPTGDPTAEVELIDLSAPSPAWTDAAGLNFPRRQHNATILPDGTVLVTGGTRGGGPPGSDLAFNNLDAGAPVHMAELWEPNATWTELAAEEVDRCYHSTAVLLPDGRVLSAGGGELQLGGAPNDPQDTHRDAQLFSPPYLFRGPQPVIDSAPGSVDYGETFVVDTPDPAAVARVTWIRLASVTHSFDMSQRFHELAFSASADSLEVTTPASPTACPPGFHMLFLLTADGVPSKAAIVQIIRPIAAAPADAHAAPRSAAPEATHAEAGAQPRAVGRRVVVGISGTCPYGIAACWGGADEGLRRLDGVAAVDPVPDAERSTAVVHLTDNRLPALDRWAEQFRRSVNGSYLLRGVEVELTGAVERRAGELVVRAVGPQPDVRLMPLGPHDKIQWDPSTRRPEAVSDEESEAFAALARTVERGSSDVAVTGPLRETDGSYELGVRLIRPH